MVRVIRTATFVAAGILTVMTVIAVAVAQVPPGVPYQPDKHPNPVATYITNRDFKPVSYAVAFKQAGFEPLGLSEKEGTRTSIELAQPSPASRKILLVDQDYPEVKVDFFPVMRQVYALRGGGQFILDAFRFPKIPLPLHLVTPILNTTAFQPGDRYWQPRFGPSAPPERLTIRGVAALLFNDGHTSDLFWREGGECYVAETKSSRKELLRLIEDLL